MLIGGVYLKWHLSPSTGVRENSAECLPIVWAYYVVFASKINLRGLGHLAPIGIGFILFSIPLSFIVDVLVEPV
jgi:hypothetical protein